MNLSLFSHSHVLCFIFLFLFDFFVRKWRQRFFETRSTSSPQAPAALWRLYGVVSMVMVTAVMGISTDWPGTSEVEKDLTGLSGIKRELAAVRVFFFKLQISGVLNDCCWEKGLVLTVNALEQKNTHPPCLSAVKLLVRGLYFSRVVKV